MNQPTRSRISAHWIPPLQIPAEIGLASVAAYLIGFHLTALFPG
jgi:hypothetical protein